MDHRTDFRTAPRPRRVPPAVSPLSSARIRALVDRVIEGAPALTSGEMRELANAILDHNTLSEQGF